MIIISIDPGYERLGIAVLEKKPKSKDLLIYSECFKTSAKLTHHERLTLIGNKVKEVIKKYKPEALAIETLFFSTNQKTVMAVAEARGTLVYCASSLGLNVYEYTPLQVKIAVTGYGRSEKSQVIAMVKRLINRDQNKKSDDEFDAVAIGLTHLASVR